MESNPISEIALSKDDSLNDYEADEVLGAFEYERTEDGYEIANKIYERHTVNRAAIIKTLSYCSL